MMARTQNPPLQGEVAAQSADGGVAPFVAVTPLRFATLSTSPFWGGSPSVVTPAKAGVQLLRSAMRMILRLSIPGFAGMMIAVSANASEKYVPSPEPLDVVIQYLMDLQNRVPNMSSKSYFCSDTKITERYKSPKLGVDLDVRFWQMAISEKFLVSPKENHHLEFTTTHPADNGRHFYIGVSYILKSDEAQLALDKETRRNDEVEKQKFVKLSKAEQEAAVLKSLDDGAMNAAAAAANAANDIIMSVPRDILLDFGFRAVGNQLDKSKSCISSIEVVS
jgi:hypothetical protein